MNTFHCAVGLKKGNGIKPQDSLYGHNQLVNATESILKNKIKNK